MGRRALWGLGGRELLVVGTGLLLGLGPLSCSSDDFSSGPDAGSPGGSAGAAGSGNSGGTGNRAGSAGSAGQVSTGGSAGQVSTGGSAGQVSTGGSAGQVSTGGSAGQTGSGGVGGGGGSGGCNNTPCPLGLHCCAGKCVNKDNDRFNCGGCGVMCTAAASFCDYGTCKAPPCANNCMQPERCCGTACCADGYLCCQVLNGGPVTDEPSCVLAVGGTCPVGCPACN